jgi:hypothetical protein
MANNQPMVTIRNLAALKGIAVMSTSRRPAGIVEGPVALYCALPSSLSANTGVSGSTQDYVAPTKVAGFSDATVMWTEIARFKASGLILAASNRGKPSSYAGLIYGLSADIAPQVGDGEANTPAMIAQLWNSLQIVILTDSGKSMYTIPLRDACVIAPNLAVAVAEDGNASPTQTEILGATGSCLMSGSPVHRITPAIPWTGQTGDDILLVYSGPAISATGNLRVYLRPWMLAAQVESTVMQDSDGGVSNLDPGSCRTELSDREVQRMIARWRAIQNGQEEDGAA